MSLNDYDNLEDMDSLMGRPGNMLDGQVVAEIIPEEGMIRVHLWPESDIKHIEVYLEGEHAGSWEPRW